MSLASIELVCWSCGRQLNNILLPFSKYEQCPHCQADLHVCKACLNFAPQYSEQCKEDRAEFISNKETSNFCDYFQANQNISHNADQQKSDQARAQLAELFGDVPAPIEEGLNPAAPSAQTESEKALAALQDLFNKDADP